MSASDQFKKNSDIFKSKQQLEQKLSELEKTLSGLYQKDKLTVITKIYNDSINYFKGIDFTVESRDRFIKAQYEQSYFNITIADPEEAYIGIWASFDINFSINGGKQTSLFVRVSPIYESTVKKIHTGNVEDRIKNAEEILSSHKPITSFKLDLQSTQGNRVTANLASANSVDELYEALFELINK